MPISGYKNIIDELIPNKKNLSKKIKKATSVNIFAVLFFAILGLVALLNTIGILPWGIWGIIWKFWPILIAMAIVQFIFGKFTGVSVIVGGLGIGLLSAMVIYSASIASSDFSNWLGQYTVWTNNIRKTLNLDPGVSLSATLYISNNEKIESATYNLTTTTGSFSIKDEESEQYLIVKAKYFEKFGIPSLSQNTEGKNLYVSFTTVHNINPALLGSEKVEYDIIFGKTKIPSILNFDINAADVDLVFDNIAIENLNIKLNAGSAEFNINKSSLPRNKEININVGAGSLRLNLPVNEFIRVNYDTSAGIVKLNKTTLNGIGSITTTNFRITEKPVDINVKLKGGTVLINTSGND